MHSLLTALLDLVLAPVCLACEAVIDARDPARFVCRRCRARLRAVPAPICLRCGAPRLKTGRTVDATCPQCIDWPTTLGHARSACILHDPADRIVYQIKYNGWKALAAPMAERMAATLAADATGRDAAVVIPVPTTATRLRTRGYNQAHLIAAALAEATGRVLLNALEREGSTVSQTGLQPASRSANVAGAFFVPHTLADSIENAHVLLVDDVLTTGATAVECANALAAAGAADITVVTFARALDARRLLAM